MKLFYALVMVAAISNGIDDAHRWYSGHAANGFTFLFAILFGIRVAMNSAEKVWPSLTAGTQAQDR